MMGVLTFSADWDRAEEMKLVRGNSSMVNNNALEEGSLNVEYADNVASDLVSVGLVRLRDFLQLSNTEFDHVQQVEHFPILQQLVFVFVPPHF